MVNDASAAARLAHERSPIPDSIIDMSILDQDAQALAEAADQLSRAETPEQLDQALAHNLSVWVAIQSIIGSERNPLPVDVRNNFYQLASFVIRATLSIGKGEVKVSTIETMIRIDLHIAEGLIRSQRNRLIRDRAYQIWEEQGRFSGNETENWLRAEREIQSLMPDCPF